MWKVYYLFVVYSDAPALEVHEPHAGLADGVAHVGGLLEVHKGRLVVGLEEVAGSHQVELAQHGQGHGVVHLGGLGEEVEGQPVVHLDAPASLSKKYHG